MRFCVIDKNTGICINVIELQSAEEFFTTNPVEVLADDHTGEIGQTWINGIWQTSGSMNLTDEELSRQVRYKRDRYLRIIVDTMNPIRWAVMTTEQQQAWVDYRQALLDVPEQEGFPTNIIWPVRPEV